MGQKVHPESMRVGYIHDWKSNWFNERDFADYLAEDIAIRRHITGKLSHAGLSDITIRKDANEVEVNIHTARPGIVIGKPGSEVDALRRDLHRMTRKQIKVNILEIKRPSSTRKLVAQSIAEQLQNRVAFRRPAEARADQRHALGRQGLVQVGGCLGGAEMARTESYLTAARRCTRCAPTSTTASTRRAHDVRAHRREALDQQGRRSCSRASAAWT